MHEMPLSSGETTIDAVKTIIREHWNSRAAHFDESPNHAIASPAERTEWQRLFTASIGQAPLDIVDVGTGTGEVALLLAGLGHHVTGVDLAEDMLAQARAKNDARGLAATFMTGDAEALPFPDASFDVVVNRHLLWTLPQPERALAEWSRVLVPGGKMVVIDGDFTCANRAQPPADGKPRPSIDAYRDYGISDRLPLPAKARPQADLDILKTLGLTCEVKRIGPGGDFFMDLPFGTRGRFCRFVLFVGKPQ